MIITQEYLFLFSLNLQNLNIDHCNKRSSENWSKSMGINLNTDET